MKSLTLLLLLAIALGCPPAIEPPSDAGSGAGGAAGGSPFAGGAVAGGRSDAAGGSAVAGGSSGGAAGGSSGGSTGGAGPGGGTVAEMCGTTPTQNDQIWQLSWAVCHAPNAGAGPFPVSFTFRNPNAEPILVSLGRGIECSWPLELFTCDRRPLRGLWCPAVCSTCYEFCPEDPTLLAADGGVSTFLWDGRANSPTCGCRNPSLPAGRYLVRKSYSRADGGLRADGGGYSAEVPFELPGDGGVVIDLPL